MNTTTTTTTTEAHHEVDHGRVDGVGDAELQLVVHLDLPRRPPHHHARARRQRGGQHLEEGGCVPSRLGTVRHRQDPSQKNQRRQPQPNPRRTTHPRQVLDDQRLGGQRLRTRHVPVAPRALRGDAVHHGAVEDDARRQVGQEGRALLGPGPQRLHRLGARHEAFNLGPVPRHVVRVDDREGAGEVRLVARVEEGRQVRHGLAPLRHARLRDPDPHHPQARQLRRQGQEGGAARRGAERAGGHHGVLGGDDAAVELDRVHLVGGRGAPGFWVLGG